MCVRSLSSILALTDFITKYLSSRFYERRDAEDAIDSMDGRNYDGRELRVAMAKYGRPEGRYGGGGGGRRGGYGGYDRDRRRR